MAIILGKVLVGIGIFGELLAIALLIYARKTRDRDWYSAAQDTGFRAILIFILGVILLSLA